MYLYIYIYIYIYSIVTICHACSGGRRRGARVLADLAGHAGPVLAVALQGGYVVSGSEDRSARIWDLEAPGGGGHVRTLRGREEDSSVLAVAIDDANIWTASEDAALAVWDRVRY